MYNPDVDTVFTFDQATRSLYGNTAFGNACITARNFLRSEFGNTIRADHAGRLGYALQYIWRKRGLAGANSYVRQRFGRSVADLSSDGLLGETLIIAMGEFGRTTGAPNGQSGRDHFLQQAVLMAGARVKGRQAIGKTDERAFAVVEPGWSQDRQIRPEDIEATIYSALGIDWTKVRYDDPLGRGFEYVPTNQGLQYAPINELWG